MYKGHLEECKSLREHLCIILLQGHCIPTWHAMSRYLVKLMELETSWGRSNYVPVNNFSVMLGRSHSFLGITSTVLGVNVSCSRIQHGDLSERGNSDQIFIVYQ